MQETHYSYKMENAMIVMTFYRYLFLMKFLSLTKVEGKIVITPPYRKAG